MRPNRNNSEVRSQSTRGGGVDNVLEQEGLGVHLGVGLSGDVKLVGQSERHLGLPHYLLVGVVWGKRVLTWINERETHRDTDREREPFKGWGRFKRWL